MYKLVYDIKYVKYATYKLFQIICAAFWSDVCAIIFAAWECILHLASLQLEVYLSDFMKTF